MARKTNSNLEPEPLREMTHLRLRTEFSFREVFGGVDRVMAAAPGGCPVGMADRHGTWGHVAWTKACKKLGRKALLGVELAVVEEARRKEKQGTSWMAFLARSNAGLKEIYELVSWASERENFYYHPRLDYDRLWDISEEVIILSGASPMFGLLPLRKKNLFIELAPTSNRKSLLWAWEKGMPLVATDDNLMPTLEDRAVYQVIAGRNVQMRTAPSHILSATEWRLLWPDAGEDPLTLAARLAEECNVELPKASLVHFENQPSLRQLCEQAAKSRRIDLRKPQYWDRLKRELDLIAEKQFEDYFYLVKDIIDYAKQHMLVGPARGSSCGSLVCYLLGITEIDPLPYDLLFERFIDINRKDLPDIDIDFPDDRRDMVFDYVRKKYGEDCVARLGTIMRYKAKSCLDAVAKQMGIPKWEIKDLKDSIIERSTGDSRAAFCIMDTFEQLDIGKSMLEKYPQLRISEKMENHASGSGQHAAGIVVTSAPVRNYCSVNNFNGAVQVDKKDAEDLNLLKIDALGLRTLSVIQDCLDHVGKDRSWILSYPTQDRKAFDVVNSQRYAGIFQFEGFALQSLCKQMTIEDFEDIASLTALARPGPLNSGGANEFLKRRTGQNPVVHLHPSIEHITKVSYGIVIYQEQVMQISREMGLLSWEDVSSLRKAMSKSLGKEFFDGYWVRFREGALKQKVREEDAQHVWDSICTFGSWGFNRSHAVAYGMVSYWTMVLKAHYPLEYAAACLRNARDEDQQIRLLRELKREGFDYRAYDPELSEKTWQVKEGLLIGGLTNIKGIGDKSADDILARRRAGLELTAGQRNKLANATTPFDTVFEAQEKFGHIRKDPARFNIVTPIVDIEQITEDDEGEFVVIAKLREKNLRDLNELQAIQKRGGKRAVGQTQYLNLTIEDDTGTMFATINKHNWARWAKPIVEQHKIGDWFLWKGFVKRGFRKLYVEKWRSLNGKEQSAISNDSVTTAN